MISPLTEYAGLWRRSAAHLIDILWILPIVSGLLYGIYGNDLITFLNQPNILTELENFAWPLFLISCLLPTLLILWFWFKYAATPGKLLFDCEIVDARSGDPIRVPQILLRYLSYFIYILPLTAILSWGCEFEITALTETIGEIGKTILCSIGYILAILPWLGLLQMSWDKRKQGWHDKLSHTVVIIHDEATLSLAQLDKYYR
jgi:uncharacterized RDD family membrane protein YckC